jgi:hypothetical protein
MTAARAQGAVVSAVSCAVQRHTDIFVAAGMRNLEKNINICIIKA